MKLREIERLRALAALMTICHHWDTVRESLPVLFRGSWTGVDLFFVISGFVVTRSILKLFPNLDATPTFAEAFDKTRDALKIFYARRFFRILPAAVTVALIHGLVGHFFPEVFGRTEEWTREIVAFLATFYAYTKPIVGYSQLGQYWSLSTEEHFYLILPLLLIAFRTRSGRLGACFGLMLFSILARAFSHPDREVANLVQYERMCSHLRFDSLMPGVMMALVERKEPSPPIMPRRLVTWLIVPVAFLLVWTLPQSGNDYVNDRVGLILIWGIAAVLVGYASLDRAYVFDIPALRRVLEYLGSRSYAIYLVHIDMPRVDNILRHRFKAYELALPGEHPLRIAAVMFLATLLLSELLHRAVEKPLMRVGQSRIRGFLAATSPAPPAEPKGTLPA